MPLSYIKKILLFIGLFITITVSSYGQDPFFLEFDDVSIPNLLESAKDHYQKAEFDSAFVKADQAYKFSNQWGYEINDSEVLTFLGDCKLNNQKFSEAIPYYIKAAGVVEYEEDMTLLKEIYSKIAYCYNRENIFDKEAEYYIKSLDYITEDQEDQKVPVLSKIGVAFIKAGIPDTAIIFIKKEINLSESLKKDPSEASARLIHAFRLMPDYDSCIHYSNKLFKTFEKSRDYREMSAIKNNIGYYYTQKSDYKSALDNYLLAVNYGDTAKITDREKAVLLANTGVCYQNLDKTEKARNQFRKALLYLKENNYPEEESSIENILALIYYNEKDLYNAAVYSKRSIESARESGNPNLLSDAYFTYSQILKEGNDPEAALEYYEKYLNITDSLDVATKLKDQQLLNKKNELEKSESNLQLRIKEEKVQELAMEQMWLQLEQEEQQRVLLEKDRDLQLLEQEKLRQSIEIAEQKHLVEQQEQEKRILEAEQNIAAMKLKDAERIQKQQEKENELLEEQQRADKLEIDKQKTEKRALRWIVVLMVLVAILILGSLINIRRKKQLLAKQKDEIEEKNLYLEQQNEEILAQRDEIEAQRNMVFEQKEAIEQYNSEIMKSIEYAKRIQAAALPDLSVLDEKVSEHFLMFRPRDIVSGDFYWVGHVEGKTIIIVSDCTGHGVPGAFMSILGTSLIKELILKEYLTHPGVILRRLRKEIITALGQKGISGEQKDGMDMALLCLDHDNKLAQYSGAYNSLYLIRDKNIESPGFEDARIIESDNANDYKLYDIPADKMPIAYFDRMDKFITREFTYYDNDRFYLFTDGFADQFGGEKGKKFMYKAFKKLILNNAHHPMKKQLDTLSRTMDKWMANYEQIDDICIVGVKV